jgi:hypothetical protein
MARRMRRGEAARGVLPGQVRRPVARRRSHASIRSASVAGAVSKPTMRDAHDRQRLSTPARATTAF